MFSASKWEKMSTGASAFGPTGDTNTTMRGKGCAKIGIAPGSSSSVVAFGFPNKARNATVNKGETHPKQAQGRRT